MTRPRPPVLAQQTFQEHQHELGCLNLSDKFRFVHRTNMWGGAESTSGVGSSLDATAAVRRGITEVCRDFKIDSVLDAPCGDAGWIMAADLPTKSYVGVDIVPELIAENTRRYASGQVEFCVADLTRDPLPQRQLILCRDCLVHLSFANIARVLGNFKASGAEYLLTTTFTEHDLNVDAADADWRLLNLELSPFVFGPPMRVVNEECDEIGGAYRDKSLALWKLAGLPEPR